MSPHLPRNRARKQELGCCDACGHVWYRRKEDKLYTAYSQCPKCKAGYLWAGTAYGEPDFNILKAETQKEAARK